MKTIQLLAKTILGLHVLTTGFAFSQNTMSTVGSGNWNDPMVWDCYCVPSELDNVVINASHSVIITDTASANDILVYNYGGITINDDQELHVNGNMDVMGYFVASFGHVIFEGSLPQYIDGNGTTINFNDLTINNQGNHPVDFYFATYTLKGVFYPLMGGIILEDYDGISFTFLSMSETQSARIEQIGTSFLFNGNFTVERFVPAGEAGARDIAASVNNGTFEMWNESIGIYGSTMPDGCATWLYECEASAKYYESNLFHDVESITDFVEVGRGYEVILADDDVESDTINFIGATLKLTGTLNEGNNITVTVSSLWDTKGNPYVSPINFNSVQRSGVSNYFYVYSPQTGSYEWYDGSNNTSSTPELANGIIAAGQGFYVNGPGTLTFCDSSKTSATAYFLKDGEMDDAVYFSLSHLESGTSCTMTFDVSSSSTDGYDAQLDIVHLMTGRESASSIGVKSDDEILRKNFFEANDQAKSFEIFTRIKLAGDYTISANNFDNFSHYNTIVLVDNLTGERIDLKSNDYSFYSEAGDFERFTIEFSNSSISTSSNLAAISENEVSGLSIYQVGDRIDISTTDDNSSDATVTVYDLSGHVTVLKLNVSLNSGVTSVLLPSGLTGLQIVVVQTETERVTKKIVL